MSLNRLEMMLRTSSRRSYVVLGLHGAGGVNEGLGEPVGGRRESEREERDGPKNSPRSALFSCLRMKIPRSPTQAGM